MSSAEKQKPAEESSTREQRLKFAALIVEHNSGFAMMSKDAAQYWIREPGAAVIYAAEALEEKFRKLSRLPFAEFFQTRPGLRVRNGFRGHIVSRAVLRDAVKVNYFDLLRNTLDSEIEVELGENHIWDESELCATLQEMLEEQWGGKFGRLLNNGSFNFFYTSSCVVSVRWDAEYDVWSVLTRERDPYPSNAQDRVFYPATGV